MAATTRGFAKIGTTAQIVQTITRSKTLAGNSEGFTPDQVRPAPVEHHTLIMPQRAA
jgi:hypothetical protein